MNKKQTTKLTLICVTLLMFQWLLTANTDLCRYEGIYKWAKKHYIAHKYRATVRKLETLLTYMDQINGNHKDSTQAKNLAKQKLKGRIFLLLGAALEKSGRKPEAKKYYQMANKTAKQLGVQTSNWIHEIGLSKMPVYKQVSLNYQL